MKLIYRNCQPTDEMEVEVELQYEVAGKPVAHVIGAKGEDALKHAKQGILFKYEYTRRKELVQFLDETQAKQKIRDSFFEMHGQEVGALKSALGLSDPIVIEQVA